MTATGGATMAMMGLSATSSILTSRTQAQAFRDKGDYDASVAETNAKLADLQGEQTLEAGDIAASRKNLETKAKVGSELAVQGASGVDVGSGSAALTRIGTNLVGATDELTIRNNAARAAWGYKVQGIMDHIQARIARQTARNESNQTLLSGGLGAISGPLSIFSNSLRWSRYMGGGSSSSTLPYQDVK